MSIGKINRKLLIVVVSFIIFVSLGISICKYSQLFIFSDEKQSAAGNAAQQDKDSLISFVALSSDDDERYKTIEIFDIAAGNVIKRIQSTSKIENEAKNYLKKITGLYVKVNAIPKKGYIIRVPFQSAITIKNQWLNSEVDEVFILFPDQGNPYLMVLDQNKRPYFYNFEGDTSVLLKELDFEPEFSQ